MPAKRYTDAQREHAFQLLADGWTVQETADEIGCSHRTIHMWMEKPWRSFEYHSPAKKKAVISVYKNSTKTMKEVAESFGVSPSLLGTWLKAAKVKTRPSPRVAKSKELKKKCIKLYKEHNSGYKVAQILGITPATVYEHIKDLPGRRRRIRKHPDKLRKRAIRLYKKYGRMYPAAKEAGVNVASLRMWLIEDGVCIIGADSKLSRLSCR